MESQAERWPYPIASCNNFQPVQCIQLRSWEAITAFPLH